MANNQSIAEEILKNIGGSDNVKNLTHCMTRLRFVLKDESQANDEEIKQIPGVMGLRKQGGQYQVIVGNNVARTYTELLELGVSDGTISEPAGGAHQDKTFVFNEIETVLVDALGDLRKLNGDELVDQRYEKYMAIGQYEE